MEIHVIPELISWPGSHLKEWKMDSDGHIDDSILGFYEHDEKLFYDKTIWHPSTNARHLTSHTQGLVTPGAHHTTSGGSKWARYLLFLWI